MSDFEVEAGLLETVGRRLLRIRSPLRLPRRRFLRGARDEDEDGDQG